MRGGLHLPGIDGGIFMRLSRRKFISLLSLGAAACVGASAFIPARPPALKDGDVFELRTEHLKLIRELQFMWIAAEAGVPGVSNLNPYGRGPDVARSVALVLGEDPPGILSRSRRRRLLRLHNELIEALAIFM